MEDVVRGSGTSRRRVKVEVPINGDVDINQNEEDCLKLPIKHCLYPEVNPGEMKLQSSICNIKVRWDSRDRDFTLQGKEVTEEEPEKSMEDAIYENQHKEVYDPDTHSLDFRKLMPTKVKSCQRVGLPPPRTATEEALLTARDVMISNETREYINECQGS